MGKLKLDRASPSGEPLGGWVAARFAVVHGRLRRCRLRRSDRAAAVGAAASPLTLRDATFSYDVIVDWPLGAVKAAA
jgi:hypothetical protein